MGWYVVDVSSIGKSQPFLSNGVLTGALMTFLARFDLPFWFFSCALNQYDPSLMSSIGKNYPFLSNGILTGALMIFLARSDLSFLCLSGSSIVL
jgi:hypothetical protein